MRKPIYRYDAAKASYFWWLKQIFLNTIEVVTDCGYYRSVLEAGKELLLSLWEVLLLLLFILSWPLFIPIAAGYRMHRDRERWSKLTPEQKEAAKERSLRAKEGK